MRAILASLLVAFAWLASPAAGALPALTPSPAASATPTAAPTIETTTAAGTDDRIAQRLSGIFTELPAFANVQVAVREGVVTLSGKVPEESDIARAEGIASRISGVVTVENRLARDVSLGSGAAVGGLAEKISGFTRMLPLLALALAVWLVISLVGYLIAGVGAVWHRIAPNSFLAELIASAIRFVFVVGGLVVALDIIGATALLGAVLGGAGLVGIALGFAMRDTVENYVASLMLSLRQPFRANDWVVIDGAEGRVIRLTSRATVLMTLDGNHLRIPNANVFKATILNYTRNPKRRFDFELGIDANDDPDAARELGRKTLERLEFVLDDPPPEARTEQVGDSNIVLKFLGWIDQDKTAWFKARSLAISAVKVALEDAGFAIPEPLYRVRIETPSGKLPVTEVTADSSPAKRASKPAPKPSPVVQEDVTPTEEIAEMVEDERRSSTGGQEEDLLDSSKPVE